MKLFAEQHLCQLCSEGFETEKEAADCAVRDAAPTAPILIVSVRAGLTYGAWEWSGDAVTADGVFGGRDYVGGEDLGLPVEASDEDVKQAVALDLEGKGLQLDDSPTWEICR